MLQMGVIRESKSPYASPVVVVRKKDGTNRVCVDYRKLNRLTVFDPAPGNTAEEIFQKMAGKKYFNSLPKSNKIKIIQTKSKSLMRFHKCFISNGYVFEQEGKMCCRIAM
jgi:hypothetical protein